LLGENTAVFTAYTLLATLLIIAGKQLLTTHTLQQWYVEQV
jgi:hypothetical protein